MAIEIERKYLVCSDAYKTMSRCSYEIRQGYLARSLDNSVRVRLRDRQGFLNIKGPSKDGGLSRFEWEMEIPYEDARNLMELCQPGRIEKIRHIVEWKGFTIEIDEFLGENLGLTVAEIELEHPSALEKVVLPDWIGEEVTGDPKYLNTSLCLKPFKEW